MHTWCIAAITTVTTRTCIYAYLKKHQQLVLSNLYPFLHTLLANYVMTLSVWPSVCLSICLFMESPVSMWYCKKVCSYELETRHMASPYDPRMHIDIGLWPLFSRSQTSKLPFGRLLKWVPSYQLETCRHLSRVRPDAYWFRGWPFWIIGTLGETLRISSAKRSYLLHGGQPKRFWSYQLGTWNYRLFSRVKPDACHFWSGCHGYWGHWVQKCQKLLWVS